VKTCRVVKILFRILPVRAWKGNALERHINRCQSCRASLALREEARDYVQKPDELIASDSIWPAVEASIKTDPQALGRRAYPFARLLKPIIGIAALAGVLLLIFVQSKPPRPTDNSRPVTLTEDFRLDSVEAWGKPAQALVYQARDSQIMVIWVK